MKLEPIAAPPALDGAACIGMWSLMDEPEDDDPDRRAVVAQACQLCQLCPALAACRAWFDALPPRQRPTGVVAGKLRTTRANARRSGKPATAAA